LLPLQYLARFTADTTAMREALLAGGDDYELLFCAPPASREAVMRLASDVVPLTRIGHITAEAGLRLVDLHGTLLPIPRGGFDHFANLTTSFVNP